MCQFYSTGEVAKICHMTIRAVQYYDKNNIVKPTKISEANRRLYSEQDIDKIKCVQLYKLMGFSLDKIKLLINDCSLDQLLEYIDQQEISTHQQITKLKERKTKLLLLKSEIQTNQKITINNIEELNAIISYRKKHKRIEKITWILLLIYQLFILTMLPIAFSVGGILPIIILILIVAFLIFLIYYHSAKNAYICPNCHYKFHISLLHDAFSFNNGKKGKILRCPNCKSYTTMKETYRAD